MKKFLFAILFLLLCMDLSAQPENWYFSISMGGCWPVSSFAATDPAKSDASFATHGFALNLDATYPLSNHWGVKGMVLLNSNPVDRNGIGTLMEDRMKKLIPFTEAQRTNLSMDVNSWLTNSMVFGPVYTINFDRIAWDFQAMAGLNVTYLPNPQLLYQSPTGNWEYLQHNTNNINLSLDLMAGTDVRIKMSEKVHLKLAVDYQQSQSTSKWEEIKSTKNGSNIITEQLNSGRTTLSKQVVMGTLGFVYYL
jgi:hypothetical protein